jgi:hypothetical protein
VYRHGGDRRASQDRNVKLPVIAAQLITTVTGTFAAAATVHATLSSVRRESAARQVPGGRRALHSRMPYDDNRLG